MCKLAVSADGFLSLLVCAKARRKSYPYLEPVTKPLRRSINWNQHLFQVLAMPAALVPDALWGVDRISPAASGAQATRWPPVPLRPKVLFGHHFRSPKRYSLADAAEDPGLRLRDDLLATAARLAAGWNLGSDELRVAELALA